MKKMYCKCALILFFLPWITSTQASAFPNYTIIQLTDNEFCEEKPQLNEKGDVVWERWDCENWNSREIFLYGSESGTITQITDNDYVDTNPRINKKGDVFWSKSFPLSDGAAKELMLYEPKSGIITQLTHTDDYLEFALTINEKGDVVIEGLDSHLNGIDVFLYDGNSGTITQLTYGAYIPCPQINKQGDVIWYEVTCCWDFGQIFLYESKTGNITRLTDADNYFEKGPVFINERGDVVWEEWDEGQSNDESYDFEIVLYDAKTGTRTQLTNNDFDDKYPQINKKGDVVWRGWNGHNWEVYLYDGKTGNIKQLSNSYGLGYESIDRRSPYINQKGDVFWSQSDGHDHEIMRYDRNTENIIQLTDNEYSDVFPAIYIYQHYPTIERPIMNKKGDLVWYGHGGIFLYDGPTGTITQLPFGRVDGINEKGDVVGRSGDGIFIATSRPNNFKQRMDLLSNKDGK